MSSDPELIPHPTNLDEWKSKKINEIIRDAEQRRVKLIEQVSQGYAAGLSIINEAEKKLLAGVEKRYADLKK